jgi:hypothetical protein
MREVTMHAGHEVLMEVDDNDSLIIGSPGVNFTNFFTSSFLYRSFLHSLYALTIWVCNFLAKGFWRKSCSLNVGETDTRRYFRLAAQASPNPLTTTIIIVVTYEIIIND